MSPGDGEGQWGYPSHKKARASLEEDKTHLGPRQSKEAADAQLKGFLGNPAGDEVMGISCTLARGDTLSQNKCGEKESGLRTEHEAHLCSRGHPESRNPPREQGRSHLRGTMGPGGARGEKGQGRWIWDRESCGISTRAPSSERQKLV